MQVPTGDASSRADSLLPDDAHRRVADQIIRASRPDDADALFDEVVRVQHNGGARRYAALAGVRLAASMHGTPITHASTRIHPITMEARGVRLVPAHDLSPAGAAAGRSTLATFEPARARREVAYSACASSEVVSADTIATHDSRQNVTRKVTHAVRALEHSLQSVFSAARMTSGERTQTLRQLYTVFSQPSLAVSATEAVAKAFVEMLRGHGRLLILPARALDSTTIQQAQCARALECLIAWSPVDPGPWHVAGVSLIDASAMQRGMVEVREQIVERIANITCVDMAVSKWAASTILAQKQASLLCDDAPADLVYGSLEWADLQIGCEIARTFDADPRSLNYTTLAGLAVALDQDVRDKTAGAHWFELGANAAVVFAASRNATHVRACLERPVVDVRELEHFALHELDARRLTRWQRVHRIARHLDAFRNASSVPVPQWRRVATDLLWEFDLDPARRETADGPTLLDQVESGPPYDSFELVLAGHSLIAASTEVRRPDLTTDVDRRFRGQLEGWLTPVRDAFVNLANDTVTAFVSAHRGLAASVREIDVLETHVRKPAGKPLSTSELIGIATQRHGGDTQRAYEDVMRGRAAGRFHPELPTLTVFRVRDDTGAQRYYVFDFAHSQGPVIEAISDDKAGWAEVLASVSARLYGEPAVADARRDAADPEYRIAVHQRLTQTHDAAGAGDASQPATVNKSADASTPVDAIKLPDDEAPAPWNGLAAALGSAFANKANALLGGSPQPNQAHRDDSARPGAVMSLLPFVTCVDAIRHRETAVAFFSCALDGLTVIPAAGFAAREGAAFADLTSRYAFAGTVARTLPRAESRFVLSRLASEYWRNVQLSAARAAPQSIGEALQVLDPGFVLAWRLISASARGASRLLASFAARSRLAPHLESFRPTPEV
ncbi:MAG TPA: hypothetical protein VL424_03300, partial [Pararobbsia sp.]|nr:hypothetical protein [Pararobbsia sp.]